MSRASWIVLIAVLSVNAQSQRAPVDGIATPTCNYSELYRKDGWTIPGLDGAKAEGKRMALTNIPQMYVTVLEPAQLESTLTDIWCSREHSGRIEVEDRPIQILHLWAFDFAGRTFAYGVSYSIDVMEDGKRMPIGASSSVLFYDVDGSGRFTLNRGARYPFMPDLIPDWVKAPKSASTRK